MDYELVEEKISDDASEVRQWSELPHEILELIARPLLMIDRLHLARVCKRWCAIARAIPRYNGLPYGSPCLLSISNGACILVDASCNEMHIKCPNVPSKSIILFSKDGWLLMLSGDKLSLDRHYNEKHSIFFFNPLTKARIDLPGISFPHSWASFSFSSPPTSPDCVVIAVAPYNESSISIHVCRHGGKKWADKQFSFEKEFSSNVSYVSPIPYQGSFYCLGSDGRLGVFDPTSNGWSILPSPKPRQDCSRAKQMSLVKSSDGELVMIFTDGFGDSVHICNLDPLMSEWEDVGTFGDGISSSACRLTTPWSKVVLGAKRVCFPGIKDGVFLYYSCKKHGFHPRGNSAGYHVLHSSFWIEPVWYEPSPEELKWSRGSK